MQESDSQGKLKLTHEPEMMFYRPIVSLKPDETYTKDRLYPDSAKSITCTESTPVWKSGVKVTFDMHNSNNNFHE